jgi:NAD(P)H dehydrogenase (quinone)
MILVTGAAGKTGQAVLGQLSGMSEPVRALVHKSVYEEQVLEAGAQETIVGDLRDQDAVRSALTGVRAVYHIPPNVHPDEQLIGETVIRAAIQAGAEHFVYHSVLHPHVEAMPHHWQKMRVEEFLFRSGIEYTILQPAAYMQNLLGQWSSIEHEGFFQMPYSVEARLSLVDLQDVVEVAGIVLTQEGHQGAIYELSGTYPLSQLDVAEILSGVLEREVRAETISIHEWAANTAQAGLGEYAVDALTKMFRYYDSYGLESNPSVLKYLLGRSPTGIGQVVRRVYGL